MPADLFPGFEARTIDVEDARLFCRVGGDGPPLVLLHGFPQTHVIWHRLAPALARHHRLVIPDLRGYGWSSAPASHDGAGYAKRVMAGDVVRLMEALGHVRFAVCGHDRGARVGYRLALDHPGRVERLSLLDILPTVEVWRNIRSGRTAPAHWAFLSGPEPVPETEILRNPVSYVEGLLAAWSGTGDLSAFHPRALAAYRQACNEPSRIHAFCEDYRAGATLDLAADEADLAAGRRLHCPVQVISGRFYLTAGAVNALESWRASFAPDAVGGAVASGHFVAEENPEAVLALLEPFLLAPAE